MDTLVRDHDELIRDYDALTLEAPTGIWTHDPAHAEPGAESIWPAVSGDETPTYLHPVPLIAAGAGYAWFLLVFWVAFAGYGYMTLTLFVATLISGVMLGLLVGGGDGGRNVAPWQRPWRSFREFLDGEVEVWGGRVPGRDAFIQLAGMAWCLAALATAFAIIVMAVRTT